MVESRQTGTLKVWKSDRGFGFIKPENGSQDVFIHITAIRKAVRDPRVGDKILYSTSLQSDGRLRAENATIQGVELRPISSKGNLRRRSSSPTKPLRKQRPNGQEPGLLAILGSTALSLLLIYFAILPVLKSLTGYSGSVTAGDDVTPAITAALDPRCNIKGNISWNSGSKYYHLPGMEDYFSTQIDVGRGERCFCSKAEAEAAGWSRAPTP